MDHQDESEIEKAVFRIKLRMIQFGVPALILVVFLALSMLIFTFWHWEGRAAIVLFFGLASTVVSAAFLVEIEPQIVTILNHRQAKRLTEKSGKHISPGKWKQDELS